jgi:hypothetical protein
MHSSAYFPRVVVCQARLVRLPAVIVHAVEQRLTQVSMLLRLLMLPRVALVHSGHHRGHRADEITVQIDEDDDGENVHILLLIVVATRGVSTYPQRCGVTGPRNAR